MRKEFGYTTLAYFIYRAAFIGISSVSLVTLTHQDSWISILIAFIIGFIPILLFYKIASIKEELNILEKIDYSFPKLGKYLKFILGLAVFCLILLNFWNLTNLVVSQFLSRTPTLVISISLIIPIIYLISQNNLVISRTSLILFFLTAMFWLLSATGLISKFQFNNLMPVLEYNPLKGVIPYISYNILPIFILLIFPNKYIKKSLFTGYVIASSSIFIVMILMIAILGINLVTIIQYPEFHILKLVFEGFLTYRLENMLATQWIFDILIFTSIGLKFCNESFNLKRIYIFPIILIFINSILFKNNTIANELVTYCFPYIIPIFFFIIPLIIYLKLRKTESKNISQHT